MNVAAEWVAANIKKRLPFSFIYGGKSSVDLLKTWKVERTSKVLDDRRTEHTVTRADVSTGLTVCSVAVEYHDFPTVEWTLYFKNTGTSDTPIIENIHALDIQIAHEDLAGDSNTQDAKEKALLHYNIGSPTTAQDYRPLIKELISNSEEYIATSGGRACNKHMPFFNLEWSGCGLVMAIGWPGQWAAKFSRNNANQIRISAGQELTHFKLHPGEEVRSPLIALQFYHGDWIRAQNIWRRWIIAHNMPRPGGELPKPQLAASMWWCSVPWGITNALAAKVFIDVYEARGFPIDAWWIDAGWYECNHPEIENESGEDKCPNGSGRIMTGGETAGAGIAAPGTGMAPGDPSWPNTGTWRADPHRYPKGIREVTDYAHEKGLKTIVWFEPMRVKLGTWLAEQHPEWLLEPLPNPGDQMYDEKNERLLNLANPDALQWVTDYIGDYLKREAIDVYREDFNIDPLNFWRANEADDRQGILEIEYVTNSLAYWDGLLDRNPGLLIDNVASGSKRQDLEFMRRGVTFWRSDYIGDVTMEESRIDANQCITYGISLWIPYYGSGGTGIDPYVLRSQMSPSYVIDIDPRRKDIDCELFRRHIAQFKQVSKYFFGDYYPLTGYSLENDVWIAWQFDCPEIGEGMIQAFRRENNSSEGNRFKLRGLQSEESYTVTNLDTDEVQHVIGRIMMEDGLSLKIPNTPAAVIITYKCESK